MAKTKLKVMVTALLLATVLCAGWGTLAPSGVRARPTDGVDDGAVRPPSAALPRSGSSKTAPAGTKPSDNGEEGNGFHDDGGDNSAYHTWQQWDKQHPDGTPGGGSTGGAGHESGTPGGQNTGHQDGEGGTTNPSGHQNTDDGTPGASVGTIAYA